MDPELNRIREAVKNGTNAEFSLSPDGVLNLKGRICIPNDEELRKQLLEEAHTTPYSVHPGATKMYKDMKEGFWWLGMKKDVANYVAKCLVCQKIRQNTNAQQEFFNRSRFQSGNESKFP